jgi:hypothetical protein
MEVKMKINMNLAALLMGCLLLAACAPSATASPVPTVSVVATLPPQNTPTLFIPTETPVVSLPTNVASTAIPTATLSVSSPVAPSPNTNPNICSDPQATALIDSLKKAMLTSDGPLFASLVSPQRGLDAANFRDGTVINYRPDQAKFLFETTFEVNWGPAPGSGAEKIGSFHDVIVPELVKAFNQPYELHCNELKHGGATYEVTWPYQGDFYSIYFPGTQANGLMDWHTWGVGIEYANNKPYLYALIPYFWEP